MTALPSWSRVLGVVAHPDDESFGLGAVLAGFVAVGARVSILCFTHGEASTLHGVPGDLRRVRDRELAEAAETLGISSTTLLNYADGGLASVCRTRLAGEILDTRREFEPDGLIVFDPSGVTGHPDHIAATAAALVAAEVLDVPVLGWTLPAEVADRLNQEMQTGFRGHSSTDVDLVVPVDRSRQREAAHRHVSQALPTSVLWRRLDLLGDHEHLRFLRPPASGARI